MENKNINQKILMAWKSGGENRDPNASIWMVVLFLLTAGSLVYNLVIHQWIVAAVFALMIVVLVWYFFGSSKSVDIAITTLGIQLNKQFYNFENIKGYWFSDKNDTFYLEPKKRTGMTISFPVGNKRIEEIKKNLPDYLTEIEGRGEDIMDRISNLFHM